MNIVSVRVINRKIVIDMENESIEGSLIIQLERIFSEFGFLRLNQNIFVNPESIVSYDSILDVVHTKSKSWPRLQVSRRNRPNVPDKLKRK